MHILKFVAANWQDIIVCLLLIAAAVAGIQKWIKVNGPAFNAMSAEEKIAYITRLLTNLTPIALALVTNAEIKYGGKTGQLKRAEVIDELYKRIPDEYKKYITVDNLDAIINKVLPEAEKLWTDNAAVKQLMTGASNVGS